MRIARGLTQDELAFRAGFSRKTLNELERGQVNPRLTTLLRVMGALDLGSIEQLASGMAQWGSLDLLEALGRTDPSAGASADETR